MKILKKSFLLATAALLALSFTGCHGSETTNNPTDSASGLEIPKAKKGSTFEKTYTIDLSKNPLSEKGCDYFVLKADVSDLIDASFWEQSTLEKTELECTATVTAVSTTSLSIKVSAVLPEKDGKVILEIYIPQSYTENETSIYQTEFVDVGNVTEESQKAFPLTLTAINNLNQIVAEDETLYFCQKCNPNSTYRYDYYYTIYNDHILKVQYKYDLSSNEYIYKDNSIYTYTLKDGIILNEKESEVGYLFKAGDTYYITAQSLPRTSGSGLFATFEKEVEEDGVSMKISLSFYKDGICKAQSSYTYEGETMSDEMYNAYHNDNGLITVSEVDNAIYDGSSIVLINGILTKTDSLPVVETDNKM